MAKTLPTKAKKEKKKRKTLPTKFEVELAFEKITENLNERQKLFCWLYTTDKYCFGNAARSYIAAYNLAKEQWGMARMAGHRLCTHVYAQQYIRNLLKIHNTDEVIDAELTKVILQDSDVKAKVAAAKEMNAVRRRTEDKPPPVTVNIDIGSSLAKMYGTPGSA